MQSKDPDLALWLRAQKRDETAFEQLRTKYRRVVQNAIRNQHYHGVRPDDLDDLEQRVWIEVWLSLPNFRATSSFLTWLFGLTRNIVLDWMRRHKSDAQSIDEVVYEERGDDGIQQNVLQFVVIQEALRNLAQNEREVNYLRYFAQLTDEEIAERLDVPLGTVKSRIRAGLSKMRASLLAAEAIGEISG